VRRNVIVLRSSVRFAVIVAAAAVAVSACGPLRLGAAAIAGSDRISQATVGTQVTSLNTGYQAARAKVRLGYRPSAMPRLALSWLLRFRIRDRLAAQHGITVSAGERQRALAQVTASVRQGGATLRTAAVVAGLPPDLLPALGRFVAIQVKLDNRLDGGTAPTSQAASAALSRQVAHLECLAAKSLDIQVNPQYGALDYSQLAVVPAATSLSAPPSGPVRPAASARLRPPC
jgi:hypothetical protein